MTDGYVTHMYSIGVSAFESSPISNRNFGAPFCLAEFGLVDRFDIFLIAVETWIYLQRI